VACLDDNVATDFVSGTLPPTAVTKVESHLASCRDCRALVAALAADSDDAHDSDARTHQHERPSHSQVGRPQAVYSIGDRVGRYLVLSKLGAGGMGVVFAAYDPNLDRKIALKLLRAGINVTTQEARSRLRREAQAIAQLSHPNVVAAYDVGTTDAGDLYVAMEFVEGDTLTTWLKKWPRTWRDILDVFQQAARGLYAAHGVNLLHRDFKPDNVLVGGDGRVRVSDFGLARSLLAGPDEAGSKSAQIATLSAELTATGTVLGTPRYMPPEQLVGPDIDARSDQFSFCVALYEALYGIHPLPGGTAVSMMEQGARAATPPADTRVPAWVHKVVARGLERDRAKRFSSMAALLAELAPAPVRSRKALVALALGAVVIGGAGIAAALSRDPNGGPVIHDDAWALERMHDLEKKLDRTEAKLHQALTQLDERPTPEQLAALQKQVAEMEAEIADLTAERAQLKALIKAQGTKPLAPPPPAPQAVQVLSAINAARSNVRACFAEWAERPKDIAGTGRNGDDPANLAVKLSVCASGGAHRQVAAGVDSPTLTGCVADALARVHYPNGDEDLDLEIAASFAAGSLSLSPHVAGHHDARAECDLD
jgi:serine/threonine protein kinase